PSLNAVLVTGEPARVTEALDLIARLDEPIEIGTSEIQTIQLKNVLAADLQETLRSFLREDLTAEQQQQAGAAGASLQRRTRQTVVVAHEESNSLLVSATQTKFKQIQRMI